MTTLQADDQAAADKGPDSDYRILGVIGIGHFMSHFYYMALPPIFVEMREAFDVSYAQLGGLIALMFAASAALQVVAGFAVDRIGARAVLVGGLLTVSVATALIGLCQSFAMVVVLSLISGLGNAVFHPTDYAILNSSISSNRMGRAFSIHTFTGQLGTAAAPVAMVVLTAAFGWRMALVVAGGLGLVALVVLLSQLRHMREDLAGQAPAGKPKSDETGRAAGGSLALVFSRQMLIFFMFFAMLSMAQSGMQAFAVTAFVTLHDMPLATASTALSVFLFTSAAGVLVGGEISDRTQRHDLLAGGVFAFTALVALVFALVNLPAAVLMLLMAMIGLGQGMTRPARDMLLRAATPKGATGKVFGFVTAGIAVGNAIAPIPFGYLVDIGRPAWVFYLIAVFMGLALFTVMTPKSPAAEQPAPAE